MTMHDPLTFWQGARLAFELGLGWAIVDGVHGLFVDVRKAVRREIEVRRMVRVGGVDRRSAERMYDATELAVRRDRP